ncbi:hypothetical protein [Sinorhizobium meliloti]|uniref:hypothetical protein n=1 Tax=Rhizobium meliloti TaxID=382 RepID=UPI001294FF38|nr:hypothetical protein [Sinorhizobium meliloti]MQU72346.1 hypothetical protein [Sinorhizobium meliloti]
MKTYDVLRQHYGDKQYLKGDIRQADPGEVKHLVDAGVLKEAKAKADKPAASKPEKADKVTANKAETASPKNKSE